LSLRCVNSTRSAFAVVSFKCCFFEKNSKLTGIVKTYNLPVIECDSLEAVYDIENSTSQIAMSSK
ncbi:hypothetical protein ACTXT7_011840, partial [Hymenolepis weldensis]